MKHKTLKDYYEHVHEKFPEVELSDIKKILTSGWRLFYQYNTYGCDVLVQDSEVWLYSGKQYKNSLLWFDYYKKKLAKKIRILYKKRKTQWDGYYYFALSDKQYEEYLSQIKPKGRKKKYFIFNNIRIFKIKEECEIVCSWSKHIFRVPKQIDYCYSKYCDHIKLANVEQIIEREPLTLKEILNKNYGR